MKRLLILSIIVIVTFSGVSQCIDSFVIGEKKFSKIPLNGLYDYSQSGFIYTEDDLREMGIDRGAVLSEIQFQFYLWRSGYTVNNQTLKLSHVREDTFPRFTYPDYRELYFISDFTTVKEDFTLTIPVNLNWISFAFDTPFIYNGGNLLISWENRDGSWKSGYGGLKGNTIYNNDRTFNWYSDDAYPTRYSNDGSGFLPNLKFKYTYVNSNPGNITICDSYTLPTIGESNFGLEGYYNNSQTNGGTPILGNVITTSQTIWILESWISESGNICSGETSFDVTINNTPVADAPADITACDGYTLPELTVGNFFRSR
jgi:hypothetical protein